MDETDPYERFVPPLPTAAEELCSCPSDTPLKLMSMRQVGGYNPIHCLDCNLEVPPERLGVTAELAEEIADWDEEHGALLTLELASGDYEDWAREQLLDPASPTNTAGRELAQRLNAVRPSYFWVFQPQEEDGWQPRETCPVCEGPLAAYDGGIFPQNVCEADRLVLVGEAASSS
jgi:predicted  nucleic acid-binding Zn ribbon protein